MILLQNLAGVVCLIYCILSWPFFLQWQMKYDIGYSLPMSRQGKYIFTLWLLTEIASAALLIKLTQ